MENHNYSSSPFNATSWETQKCYSNSIKIALRYFKLFIYLFFIINTSKAQETRKRINQIKSVLDTAKDDYLKAKYYNYLSYEYVMMDLDLSKLYNDTLFTLAKKLKEDSLIGQAYNLKGIVSHNYGEEQDALNYYDSADHYFAKTGIMHLRISTMTNKAHLQSSMGNHIGAIRTYEELLKFHHPFQDSSMKLSLYNGIAIVFEDQGEFQQALKSYHKSLSYSDNIVEKWHRVLILSNLGNCYATVKDFHNADHYLNLALTEGRENGKLWLLSDIHCNYGNLLTRNNKLKTGFLHLDSALNIAIKKKYLQGIERAMHFKARALLREGNIQTALQTALRSHQYTDSFNSVGTKIKSLDLLAEIQSLSKNYEAAYKAISEARLLKDSVINLSSKNTINYLHELFESENKDKLISMKEQSLAIEKANNQKLWIIFTSILFTLTLSILLRSIIRKRKKDKQNLKHTKELVTKQKVERIKIAKYIHDRVCSDIQIAIHQASGKSKETLQATYFNLKKVSQQLNENRYDNCSIQDILIDIIDHFEGISNINLKVRIQPESLLLNSNSINQNLAYITSELIANSLKHSQCKNINIEVIQLKNNIALQYNDDGIGIRKDFTKGDGIQNITQRAISINGQQDMPMNTGNGFFYQLLIKDIEPAHSIN